MKKTLRIAAALSASILVGTMSAYAQTTGAAGAVTGGLNTLSGLVNTFTTGIVSGLATLFATMAMVAFFWGIVQFIWGTRDGDATKSKNGKNFMLWGLIALFVMFSVWGIIIYIQTIFGIQGQNTITIPRINIGTSATTPTPSTTGLPSGAQTTTYTCPDGVTTYTNPADSSRCPVYYCPNGTAYYNPSDSRFCGTGTASCGTAGAACTKDGFNGICGTDGICQVGGSR